MDIYYSSKIKTNLKKVQGQIAVIEKMVDEERYCIDVAQQVNAAIGLLKQTNNYLLENHLTCCGAEKLVSKKKDERIHFAKELIKVFNITKK